MTKTKSNPNLSWEVNKILRSNEYLGFVKIFGEQTPKTLENVTSDKKHLQIAEFMQNSYITLFRRIPDKNAKYSIIYAEIYPNEIAKVKSFETHGLTPCKLHGNPFCVVCNNSEKYDQEADRAAMLKNMKARIESQKSESSKKLKTEEIEETVTVSRNKFNLTDIESF